VDSLLHSLAGSRERPLAAIYALVLLLALNGVRIVDEDAEDKLVIVKPGAVNELV
jgi:hypothetical protein